MLSAQHLVKSFPGRGRVIEDVTLNLVRGEVVGLLGPNGAGKTTTFQMLTGMVMPDAGAISLDGHAITTMPFYDRARFGIAYLPQAPFVPRALTVSQNILMVLEARLAGTAARKARLDQLIAEFRLEDVHGKRVGELSGGQRRRCEIAITLACEPRFALMDEPFAGVDPHATDEITGLIRDLAARDIGVLVTDHKARELLSIVDRAYVIESGRVLAEGEAASIVANEAVRRAYLGEAFRL
ncbi:MAG TPA: LPS export ABC transporter ATP-binding protein [Rhizomicrobium sp.]|jgi:lipopolysaccharide export system ATP-binding protein|nr:LPS export ABC transporter ATP-binding protein [Rhizomicrobium sp.]